MFMFLQEKGCSEMKTNHGGVLGVILIMGLLVISAASASQDQSSIQEQTSNEAASVTIIRTQMEDEIASVEAAAGKTFVVVETEWKNIHPKQKVAKSDLENKPDRTMGVGGLMGGKAKKEEEYVDADVAYLVPNFLDHAYLLADGQAYALDKLTEAIPGGIKLRGEFSLPKQGDAKKVNFVFLIPESSQNTAFQFFDYSYGHILIPIRGNLKLAAGGAAAEAKALGSFKDSLLEMAAVGLNFRPEYNENEAPDGWRFAVVKLNGRSLSSGGSQKNIVQLEPEEYIWVATKEGYLYYSCGGSTDDDGYIRFTPDFSQSQEVAFLVPAAEQNLSLGMRVGNRVYSLALSAEPGEPSAKPQAVHRDGRTMEVMVFGARREDGRVILDLGIKSLADSGIEIQTSPQFMLESEGEQIESDEAATSELIHRPPEPFIIPPKAFVRFELAYETEGTPKVLHYRGYESEGDLPIRGLEK
jgi:hypothetical protein